MKKKSVKVYVCGVDFKYELSNAAGGNVIYPSVEDLKAHAKCWKGCGIVELNVTLSKWIEKENFEEMTKNAIPAGDLPKYQIAETKKQIKGLQAFLKRLQKEKNL